MGQFHAFSSLLTSTWRGLVSATLVLALAMPSTGAVANARRSSVVASDTAQRGPTKSAARLRSVEGRGKLTKRERRLLGPNLRPGAKLTHSAASAERVAQLAGGIDILRDALTNLEVPASVPVHLMVEAMADHELWQAAPVKALVAAARAGTLNFDNPKLLAHPRIIPVLRHIQAQTPSQVPTSAAAKKSIARRKATATQRIKFISDSDEFTLWAAAHAGVFAPELVAQGDALEETEKAAKKRGSTPRGIYETKSGRVGFYEGRGWGKHHRLSRHINPRRKGEAAFIADRLAGSGLPRPYDAFLKAADDSIPIETFDAMLEASVQPGVHKELDAVMDTATALWKADLGEAPPIDRKSWKRSLLLSYVHSRDLTAILHGLGYPRSTTGLHDVSEFVKADALQKQALDHADPWFIRLTHSFAPDESINVGGFNPYAAAGFAKWGDVKEELVQNVMDWHRMAPHHTGNPEEPLDVVERAANFVVHHGPREYMGIRHEPRGDLNYKDGKLAHALAHDPAIMHHPVGKAIARDTAFVIAALEETGYVVPWGKLKIPTKAPVLVHERAHTVLRDQAKWAKLIRAERLGNAIIELDALPTGDALRIDGEIVRNLIQRLAATGEPNRAPAVKAYRKLIRTAGKSPSAAGKAVTEELGRALAATLAELAVTDLAAAPAHFDALEAVYALAGLDKQDHHDILPIEELKKSVQLVPAFKAALAELDAAGDGDSAVADAYRGWIAAAQASSGAAK